MVRPHDAGEVRGVELSAAPRTGSAGRAGSASCRTGLEVVDPDQPRRPLARVVVEVLVPAPMVDHDQVAGLPGMADVVDLAMAASRRSRTARPRRRGGGATGRGLVPARASPPQPAGVVPDRLVDHEQAAGTALGDQPSTSSKRVIKRALSAALRLAGQALRAAGIGICRRPAASIWRGAAAARRRACRRPPRGAPTPNCSSIGWTLQVWNTAGRVALAAMPVPRPGWAGGACPTGATRCAGRRSRSSPSRTR